MSWTRTAMAALLLLGTAACGGGGEDGPFLEERLFDFEDLTPSNDAIVAPFELAPGLHVTATDPVEALYVLGDDGSFGVGCDGLPSSGQRLLGLSGDALELTFDEAVAEVSFYVDGFDTRPFAIEAYDEAGDKIAEIQRVGSCPSLDENDLVTIVMEDNRIKRIAVVGDTHVLDELVTRTYR